MPSQDLSIITLIAQAGLFVKLIMITLAGMSIISWWGIFGKGFSLGSVKRANLDFESRFWSGADIGQLLREAASKGEQLQGVERIFNAGYGEFLKLRKQGGVELPEMIQSSRRAMLAASQRELDELEDSLSFLGTVGSVSPYIGLLGTVWGIMSAFQGLSVAGQATLSQVAPGIAEALVATAMGLLAAIPAVIAYNKYTHQIDRLANRFDGFIEEFSNLLQRHGNQPR